MCATCAVSSWAELEIFSQGQTFEQLLNKSDKYSSDVLSKLAKSRVSEEDIWSVCANGNTKYLEDRSSEEEKRKVALDIKGRDLLENTPLQKACVNTQASVVAFLLRNGAEAKAVAGVSLRDVANNINNSLPFPYL